METSEFDGFGYFLYNYAAKFAHGRKILEIGCGIGVGANILASNTQRLVVGIDRSQKAIKRASKKKPANLHFRLFDIRNLAKLGEKFDLVTIFSTLEHFSKDEQKSILRDIYSLLEKDGVCVLSTNNKSLTTVRNPFHKDELTSQEFKQLINEFFKADFFGVKQAFHPQFKREGVKNKFVNLVFQPAFVQEKIQPLIPKKIKDFINAMFLRLPPSLESDFSLQADLDGCDNFLAVCKKF